MEIKNVYASIMTANVEQAYKWYKNLFSRKCDFNPMEGHYEWNFPDGGVVQLFEDKERAGYSSITLMIEDRDAHMEHLKASSIEIGPTTESDIAKTVTINDPEGNRITFAEKAPS